MLHHYIKLLTVGFLSTIVIYFYFSTKAVIPNFDGYVGYAIIMFVIYGLYKIITLDGEKKKLNFSPLDILGWFCVHLFILSILFFVYNGESLGNGLLMFASICVYAIVPLVLSTIFHGLGRISLGNFLGEYFYQKSGIYKTIVSLVFGMFLFITALSALGLMGMYTQLSFFVIVGLSIILSYKEIWHSLKECTEKQFFIENHNTNSDNILSILAPKLLSIEFFFIIITLVLSVNFISIMRPFPIGWDDLGVYMNFPSLLAQSGNVGELGGMISWQTFTGIGYLFSSPPLAFFLNNLGGIFSTIILAAIVSELFKNTEKTFISLPLLAALLFMSLPMIVFQQAKDMKLDPALFCVSITALYMLYDFYISKSLLEKNNKKSVNIKLFLVIGMLLGFAFTIKFTSLLLISAVLGVLFYTRIGTLGLLGYISVYVGVFTQLGLWKMMNVTLPTDKDFTTNVFIISLIIGIFCIIGGAVRYKESYYTKFFIRTGSLLLGILIAILPWAVSHISQSNSLSLSTVLHGERVKFDADYSKIYQEQELIGIIQKVSKISNVDSSGVSNNADLGRYFGYEEGINNYLKLPVNLTLQKNQKGEFTDIGFIFLALLPVLFLFLPFRRKEYVVGVYVLLTLEILLFFIPLSRELITDLFALIHLPVGYLVLLGMGLLPVIYLLKSVKEDSLTQLFKINLIFSTIYIFLWAISAFGIVWYGIVMYFNMILMMIFGIYYATSYKSIDSKKTPHKLVSTILLTSIIGVYIFFSVIPNTFTNLKMAGYIEFKKGEMSVDESPFRFHREYLPVLFELNVGEESRKEFIHSHITDQKIIKILENNKAGGDIVMTREILNLITQDTRLDLEIQKAASKSLHNLYSGILHPEKKYKNTEGIYRIGTFLKYHISENNKRLYEDSLIMGFSQYIYDNDPNIVAERLKKIGLKYLLVDLNAATIDRDPRRDLTRRYEGLLRSFTSEKLTLIDTDSICLKVALEEYKSDGDLEKYMKLAGVNYISYGKTEAENITKGTKKVACYSHIVELFTQNKVNGVNYNYLLLYKEPIKKYNTLNEKMGFLDKYGGHGFKVLFRVD